MITEAFTLLTTLCYLTCTMITEAGSLLTTPCYLASTMITEAGSLLTTPCYLTCTMITEAGSLLTTPCYLTCTMITEAGSLLTAPCHLTCTMITEAGFLPTTSCYLKKFHIKLCHIFSGLSLDNMMLFCTNAIQHNSGEVRDKAERIIISLYKQNGAPVKGYLPPDIEKTRKNVLYKKLFETFDRIDGKPSKDDIKVCLTRDKWATISIIYQNI